ncbi:MAG TPA: ABC transporter ATP-binding protein [Nakamurella sp.]
MSPSDPADAAVPSASGAGGVATVDTDPAVQVRELGFTVGGAVILADIDLTIARGELLAVIGPNGAGKSTLVNMISGVARPTAGQIRLNGRDVTRLSVRHRARAGMGRTFQTSSLFNGLTTVQNVCFAVQSAAPGALNPFRRASSPAVVTQAMELLERVGMAARSSWPTAALSHGDKRKLELAVAMARRPDLLLLDEPMAGVAMEDVPSLVQLIADLNADGVTVCMVEHHMHAVLGLADRIAVLHHGRLLAVGTPSEVTANQDVRRAYLGDAL